VIARDRTCRFGHCNRSARRCEIDHRIRYSDGGTTSADNCHHHVKDDDVGWRVEPLTGGALRWASPTGHVYVKPAATYPIDRTV
jgi:hypothetical protein